MRVFQTDNMRLQVPTNIYTDSSGAEFSYECDDRIFRAELAKFIRKHGFDALPPGFIHMLHEELEVVRAALLKAVGQSVVSAIRAGGIMNKVVGYSGGRAIFLPASGRAGNRIFRIRTGQLSSACSYTVVNGTLHIKWGPVFGGEPSPTYVRPIDSASIPFKGRPPIDAYLATGEREGGANKVAAIESGDPVFQRQPTIAFKGLGGFASMQGYHPFEGAIKHNVKPLERAYTLAVRDLFDKGIFIQGGRQLSLPVYVNSVFADSVKKFYDSEIKPVKTITPVKSLQSNENSFFSTLKKIFPSNSVFIKSLTFSDIRVLFSKFKKGKSRDMSRENIGILDSELVSKFVNDSRGSIQKFLSKVEDEL